ncbi:MAG: MBL fold metallo-hydrolase [Thermoanaerobaculia bacterium]
MLIVPLGSGSGGNCTYYESDGTRLLVDAGFGPRETAKRLAAIGRSIEQLDAILITHEHSDHVHGAEKIARKFGVRIFLTEGTLGATRIDPDEAPVVPFANDRAFRIGEVLVHPRRTIHDAADSACFVLEARDGTRAGIASDLGYADPAVVGHLRDCEVLLFEANHDLDMLRTGTYPWSLKRRILSNHGHLSNDDAMVAIRKMIGPATRSLCLIHLSEKNNHPAIVEPMARAMLAEVGARIELRIAEQRRPIAPFVANRGAIPPPVRSFRPAQLALF